MTSNPWRGKVVRSIYDPGIGGYWFSVIDLFAILTDNTHFAARNYWKWLKHQQSCEATKVVSVTNHLRLESPNGQHHFTEVVDFKNLIHLIQTCPSPKANPYRLWLADALLSGTSAKELEDELGKLGVEAAEKIAQRYDAGAGEEFVRRTVERRELFS